jgi:hypothetical protein
MPSTGRVAGFLRLSESVGSVRLFGRLSPYESCQSFNYCWLCYSCATQSCVLILLSAVATITACWFFCLSCRWVRFCVYWCCRTAGEYWFCHDLRFRPVGQPGIHGHDFLIAGFSGRLVATWKRKSRTHIVHLLGLLSALTALLILLEKPPAQFFLIEHDRVSIVHLALFLSGWAAAVLNAGFFLNRPLSFKAGAVVLETLDPVFDAGAVIPAFLPRTLCRFRRTGHPGMGQPTCPR